MTEVRALSPNRWPGALEDFRYWVIHTTQGTSSLGWLRNPASQVSATFLIPRDGPDYWRLGEDGDAMWHAGFVASPSTPMYDGVNPNLEAPGIEFEGYADQDVTDFQIRTAAALIRARPAPLVAHWELATTGPNYRSDPGRANMARLTAAVGGGADMALSAADKQYVDNRIREIVMGEDIAPFAVYLALGRATGNLPPRKVKRGTSGRTVAAKGQKGAWPKGRGPEPLAHRKG